MKLETKIKKAIKEIKNTNVQNFFMVSFSETVRKVSNTKNGEFKLEEKKEESEQKIEEIIEKIIPKQDTQDEPVIVEEIVVQEQNNDFEVIKAEKTGESGGSNVEPVSENNNSNHFFVFVFFLFHIHIFYKNINTLENIF
ncbi:hypothetical protein KJ684_03465, partial [Patescibacteria group bacterium]|nr:hypothetical protein [Patescibacteria group bacterium]